MRMSALLLSLCVAACAPMRWHHPNSSTTQADYQRDQYDCEMRAAQAYPANMVAQGGQTATFVQPTTNCTTYGNQTTCRTNPGVSNTTPVYYVDVNANSRAYATRSCMAAKGYSFSR